MSELEKRIEQWRADLTASETLGSSDINELEGHLREEMDALNAPGLSPNEAFLVARHRLGQTTALADEFAKVNGPKRLRHRLWWMMAGVLAYLLAAHVGSIAAALSMAITQTGNLNPHIRGFIAITARTGAFCAMGAVVLWLCFRCTRPESCTNVPISRRVRLAFLLALFVETLVFCVMRIFYIPCAVRMMGAQDYGQLVMVESIGTFVLKLVGPVLLGALLIVIHTARQREAHTQ